MKPVLLVIVCLLVRAEIMRGEFRNSYENPEPFVPGKITEVKINLNNVCHTFKKNHKIMVQVQSSLFPIADRNPQKFMRIPDADEKDFQKQPSGFIMMRSIIQKLYYPFYRNKVYKNSSRHIQ